MIPYYLCVVNKKCLERSAHEKKNLQMDLNLGIANPCQHCFIPSEHVQNPKLRHRLNNLQIKTIMSLTPILFPCNKQEAQS